MHRIVAVLGREQFVSRSPSNRPYFLGPAARQLAVENTRGQALLVASHEALSVTAAASGESVLLTELVGDRVVCVSLIESVHPLRMFVRIGQEMPLLTLGCAREPQLEADDRLATVAAPSKQAVLRLVRSAYRHLVVECPHRTRVEHGGVELRAVS